MAHRLERVAAEVRGARQVVETLGDEVATMRGRAPLACDAAVAAMLRIEGELLELAYPVAAGAPPARFRAPSAPAELDDVVLCDVEDFGREPTRPWLVAALIALVVVAFFGGCASAAPTAPAASLGSVVDVLGLTPDAAPTAPAPTSWVLYAGGDPAAAGWTVDAAPGAIVIVGSDSVTLNTNSEATLTSCGPPAPLTCWVRGPDPRSLMLTMRHPTVPRAALHVEVGLRLISAGRGFDQIDDPTMPAGLRIESGFSVQLGSSPGEAISIGSDGFEWADRAQSYRGPDNCMLGSRTLRIDVDAAGNARASLGGDTVQRAGFRPSGSIVIGDLDEEPGENADVVIESVVQSEPPGGVSL